MSDNRVTIKKRTSVTTGVELYQITKPGYKFDFLLSGEQVDELLDELKRLGRI